jgi:hypothetical protein
MWEKHKRDISDPPQEIGESAEGAAALMRCVTCEKSTADSPEKPVRRNDRLMRAVINGIAPHQKLRHLERIPAVLRKQRCFVLGFDGLQHLGAGGLSFYGLLV